MIQLRFYGSTLNRKTSDGTWERKSTVRNSFGSIAFDEKRKRPRRDRTMRENDSRNGELGVAIEYTDKPVSGWGGLAVMFRYFEGLGVLGYLKQGLPAGGTSA